MNNDESKQITCLTYKIGKLEGKMEGMQKRFDEFIDNDFKHLHDNFKHLRSRVDWILWVFILGTLASIAISLFLKLVI